MGGGLYGGFGNTKGSSREKTSLPTDKSQLSHIFGNRPGHLPDTPANRALLENLARDDSKYIGTDKYGNRWNAETTENGVQNWVRYQNGVINEGGQNQFPRPWNSDTGLNNNPIKRRT